MTAAIRIENLSKRYFVDHDDRARTGNYRTLRESLSHLAAAPLRRLRGERQTSREEFWALKDVSFEVQPGEVLGIIGRNGAGKSTLLKVLSRITKPTAGRVELNGRVGSLLEVGTGFHPELTGRENIYLNGSILGMPKREIDRRFDEIVAFAEIEQFLDTPVKRYSSGMYVRLAFAVAAHLEPELLIVDEVLAVGDAGFQRRCFDKLRSLRTSGRTVLLVTHNLGAVANICTRAINLESGTLVSSGQPQQQVTWYLSRLADQSRKSLDHRTDREGDQLARITALEFRNSLNQPVEHAITGGDIGIVLRCQTSSPSVVVDYVAISLWTAEGTKVFHIDNTMRASDITLSVRDRVFTCKLPRIALPAGMYYWNAALSGEGRTRDHVYSAANMEILPGDFFGVGQTVNAEGGMLLVDHEWTSSEAQSFAHRHILPREMMIV